MDGEDDGFATGLSTAITKDGQQTVTADIPMNAHKFTGMADGTAATDSATARQLQNSNTTYFTASGTDTYTLTPVPAITALAAGQKWNILFTNANAITTPTLAVSGLTAKTLTKRGAVALVAGDIAAASIVTVQYDGTQYQIIGGRAGIIDQGQHSIPVSAAAMTPNTTNGAAYSSTESATNKVMTVGYTFDQTTLQSVQLPYVMPVSWDEGTITVKFYWETAIAGTNAVVWGCKAQALSDGDTVDTAFGTGVTVTKASSGAGKENITAFTAAITIAGSPSPGDKVIFYFYRDASAGGDTLAGDAKLTDVIINIGIAAATD